MARVSKVNCSTAASLASLGHHFLIILFLMFVIASFTSLCLIMTTGSVTESNKNNIVDMLEVTNNAGGILVSGETTLIITVVIIPGIVVRMTLKKSRKNVSVAFHSFLWRLSETGDGVAFMTLKDFIKSIL